MQTDHSSSEASQQSPRSRDSDSWVNNLQSLSGEVRALLADLLNLLATESQIAGMSAAQIIALSLASALLAVTAWFCLVAALAALVATHSWLWPVTLVSIALINAAAAFLLWRWIRSISTNLGFPGLRRHIALAESSDSA